MYSISDSSFLTTSIPLLSLSRRSKDMEAGQKTYLDLKEKVEYTADDGEIVEEEEEEEGDEGEIEFGSKNGGIKKTKLAFGGGSGKRRSGGSSGGGGVSPPCCQAENCAAYLTEAKRYHRRHKVCELHSKATAVVVAGRRQRFCQQCSRFHELSEFDDTKRSCRSRLAGHNERRRKSSSEPTGQPRLGIQLNEDVAIPGIPNYKQFHFH